MSNYTLLNDYPNLEKAITNQNSKEFNKSVNKSKYEFENLILKGYDDSFSIVEHDPKVIKNEISDQITTNHIVLDTKNQGTNGVSRAVEKNELINVSTTEVFTKSTEALVQHLDKRHVSKSYAVSDFSFNKLPGYKKISGLAASTALYSNIVHTKKANKTKESIHIVQTDTGYSLHIKGVDEKFNVERILEYLNHINKEYNINITIVHVNNALAYDGSNTKTNLVEKTESDDSSINYYI